MFWRRKDKEKDSEQEVVQREIEEEQEDLKKQLRLLQLQVGVIKRRPYRPQRGREA